jgi:hypothetical protein
LVALVWLLGSALVTKSLTEKPCLLPQTIRQGQNMNTCGHNLHRQGMNKAESGSKPLTRAC